VNGFAAGWKGHNTDRMTEESPTARPSARNEHLVFRECLQRSVSCCLMNGSNHLDEMDGTPLYPCPVCLRKLLWNLQAEPVFFLRRVAAFCGRHGLAEAAWYAEAADALAS
jgi:hypothetical protein